MKRVEYKYADVKYDRSTGTIEGRTNMGFEGDLYDFSASPDLFAVSLSLEVEQRSITQFMSIADGYGYPGHFPGGYDWSGIRDSSEGATAAMFELAQGVLAPHAKRLLAMGLPVALVADLTGTGVKDEPIGVFDEVVVTPKRRKAN